jgi:hypothetical protein
MTKRLTIIFLVLTIVLLSIVTWTWVWVTAPSASAAKVVVVVFLLSTVELVAFIGISWLAISILRKIIAERIIAGALIAVSVILFFGIMWWLMPGDDVDLRCSALYRQGFSLVVPAMTITAAVCEMRHATQISVWFSMFAIFTLTSSLIIVHQLHAFRGLLF